jgi:hypothetical protein
LKADTVVARLIDADNNSVVDAATVKARASEVNYYLLTLTSELATVDLYDTSGGSSLVAAGTNYEVRAYLSTVNN